ncbi:hypothetical protein SAMN05421505_11185 [Sinosporangium album]|uniref:Uncharacterized protein n=1 Tax=Sinosporangium album TaxID=504805 RepID=A0A1G7ZJM4_9ACTN|nr:hypothetical protein [Sinosporangium album]SDH08991.1 hypothetical protein SAMN05421505_11185 [Sinosporangium album]
MSPAREIPEFHVSGQESGTWEARWQGDSADAPPAAASDTFRGLELACIAARIARTWRSS